MTTNLLKLEKMAKKIISRSKVKVHYFGDKGLTNVMGVDDEEHKKNLLDDIQETYKNMPSIYNQKSNLSPRNIVLRSIVINMFNYNFWGEGEVLPNSSKLLETVYKTFNSNKTLDLFYGNKDDRFEFIELLRNSITKEQFKCQHLYLDDVNNLNNILFTPKRKKLYAYISKVIEGNISIQNHIKSLGKLWPSYGKDEFYKREILSWYFIKDVIPSTVLKRIPNEELYFPIDYRLPSALNHMNFMFFPEEYDKYFNGEEVLKNKEDERLIRAVSFLSLINLNRWLELDAHKLDYYFFSKSRTLYKTKHLKFETTDY